MRILLKVPAVPVLSALTDRAGMMVSPAAVKAAGEAFARKPVCAGPYRFVEHRAQDRVVLEKYAQHWRAADYAFDRLIFRGMPDSSVRLANLKAGGVQLIERLAPSDVGGVGQDKSLQVVDGATLGYYGVTFNVANGEAAPRDAAKARAIRKAIDLAIDRQVINQVAFEGRYSAGNQPFPPESPWYDRGAPVPARDVEGARAILKAAGVTAPSVELLVPTDPERQQVAQIMQAMLAEAGIALTIRPTELVSLLSAGRQGQFQAYLVGWSGRADPDLNITPMLGCGAAGNDSRYCNRDLDAVLAGARAVADPAARKPLYDQADRILREDLPIVYVYHGRWTFAARAGLQGLRAYPDGVIRLDGVTLR